MTRSYLNSGGMRDRYIEPSSFKQQQQTLFPNLFPYLFPRLFSILNVTYIKTASCFSSQLTMVVMATVSMALAVVATSGLRCGIVCGSSEAWCPWEMMA